ncbi:MAG: hypothetical protein C4331_08555 [Meiothermus sp.]
MRIHQLWVETHRLDEVLEFYSKVLELPVLERTDDAVTFQIGASKLTFEQAEAGERPFYHFAFNIPSNQLAEAKAWVERRAKLIQDGHGRDAFHFENWNVDAFYFYDPAGNIAEFIARHTLDNRSNETFSASSLLCISEIGIVCDDVPATAKWLQRQTGAPLYHTEVNDSFLPVGDEHGLFIVVKRGRIWFPDTGKAAEPAPFRIALFGSDGVVHISSEERGDYMAQEYKRDIRQVIAQAEAFQNDPERFNELLIPDVVVTNVAGLRVRGKDEPARVMRAAMQTPVADIITKLHYKE